QYSHDFAAAMLDFEAATRTDPDDAEAWSWRAAIHMVQADYAAARADCEGLRRGAGELGYVGCVAYLDGTTGRAADAHRALTQALARARDASPGEKVWVYTRLAELAQRMGDAALEERYLKTALEQKFTDQYLLGAWSDFLLDHGRAAEVVPLL